MTAEAGAFGIDVADGVCRCELTNGRFLSTGFDGGFSRADAAYNLTVPDGWGDAGRRDLQTYVTERLTDAGFRSNRSAGAFESSREADGDRGVSSPALLTGVDQQHARVARLASVTVVATAGISNPAALPVESTVDAARPTGRSVGDRSEDGVVTSTKEPPDDDRPPIGTVNLLVGTSRDLTRGALANLVAVVAEAKAATLLTTTGFPGTTSDAIVVASDPSGESTAFSGSATAVGSATRICVRDAVLASLDSRYAEESVANTVAEAEHGVVSDRRATVESLV